MQKAKQPTRTAWATHTAIVFIMVLIVIVIGLLGFLFYAAVTQSQPLANVVPLASFLGVLLVNLLKKLEMYIVFLYRLNYIHERKVKLSDQEITTVFAFPDTRSDDSMSKQFLSMLEKWIQKRNP